MWRRDPLRFVVALKQFSEFVTESRLEYTFLLVGLCGAQADDNILGTGNVSQLLPDSERAHC